MKIISSYLLILFACMAFSSCTPVQAPKETTKTPRPRPLMEYNLGIWHSEISTQMMDKGTTILNNFGESQAEFEIEILPATSLKDELIIIKYGNWPESVDLGLAWYWIFLTIATESDKYMLDPQAVIAAEFGKTPYGEFDIQNENLIGFCEIPWQSVNTYTASGGQDETDVKMFVDTWECSYR